MVADNNETFSLETVMKAIKESKEDLSKQIDAKTISIQNTLTKIETSLSTLSEQVEEIEGRIAANEDNMSNALIFKNSAVEFLKISQL